MPMTHVDKVKETSIEVGKKPTARLGELEIPKENPLRNDMLDRKKLVGRLVSLIKSLEGPFVMALDAPWGTGKTTLVRMLKATLENEKDGGKNAPLCIEFNAWKVDYTSDPLVALVSSFDRDVFGKNRRLDDVKKVVSKLAWPAARAAIKVATCGSIDIEDISKVIVADAVADAAENFVDAFSQEVRLLEEFREELQKAIQHLPAPETGPGLVVFIDELDRCRPPFAIALLERIKHLFDIPGLIFVLSLDKHQLEASTAAVYGEKINAAEYLRRFIDLEYRLPDALSEKYIGDLIKRHELEDTFKQFQDGHYDALWDNDPFSKCFTPLARLLGLSLRACEGCILRLKTVMDQTPKDQYMYPSLVALLIILKSNRPDLLQKIIDGDTPEDVMKDLEALPGGKEYVNSNIGYDLNAYLIHADPDKDRAERSVVRWRERTDDNSQPDGIEKRAALIVHYVEILKRDIRHNQLPLDKLAARIDLAAMIKD